MEEDSGREGEGEGGREGEMGWRGRVRETGDDRDKQTDRQRGSKTMYRSLLSFDPRQTTIPLHYPVAWTERVSKPVNIDTSSHKAFWILQLVLSQG